MPLKILYEDNHIIVVVKPVGVPVQADKSGDEDMLTIIKAYLKEKYQKPGNVYLGLVHRLDRMVGGVMVFAKTSKAASRISEYIRQKNVKKRYVAVVNGTLPVSSEEITLQHELLKNERTNMSSVVIHHPKVKEAILTYHVLGNFTYRQKPYSLVDVNLQTGRHHQIRVQFAHISHPLYGDVKYGQKINKIGQNLALWSYYLSFFHPTKDEYLEFRCYPDEVTGFDQIWSECKAWI